MVLELKEYKKTVGTKQAKRAVANDEANSVIIAKDADRHVITELINMCKEKNIEIIYVDNMKELGKACGIDVRAASVALLK